MTVTPFARGFAGPHSRYDTSSESATTFGPLAIPEPSASGQEWLRQRLFEHRIVMIKGTLDRDQASSGIAQLIALGSDSHQPIRRHIDSPGRDVAAALLLADAVDTLRAPVDALVIGEVGGSALAVLTAADRRTAYRHARVHLCEPVLDRRELEVGDAERFHDLMVTDLVHRLAGVCRKAMDEVASDLNQDRYLTAQEAVSYGLFDSLARAHVR